MKAARPKQWALSAWLRAELASLSKNGGECFSQQAASLSPHSFETGPGIVLHSMALHPSFKMWPPSRLPFGPSGAWGARRELRCIESCRPHPPPPSKVSVLNMEATSPAKLVDLLADDVDFWKEFADSSADLAEKSAISRFALRNYVKS